MKRTIDQKAVQSIEATSLVETSGSKSFLDSLRDTFRNKTLMLLLLTLGISSNCNKCDIKCTVFDKPLVGVSYTDKSESSKKKDPTYEELKKKDTSDL